MSPSPFRPVNTSLGPDQYHRHGESTTPTTPRPSTAPNIQPQPLSRMEDATTPTRATFTSSALANQRPLPVSPFPAAVSVPDNTDDTITTLNRENSTTSNRSRGSDVDMGRSDDGEGSENGSVNGDGSRSNKKKKTQRFFCMDYPPCNLSFTRSEHLARHIRKHTGERPFQCHCTRRFSRLDNLRQHAQTVHVNEEIPAESLAASSTRYQRQVRADRVRPTPNRPRAATASSQPGAPRGHHRNSLSTSSIGSMASNYSMRPAPLEMERNRGRYSQEVYGAPDSPYTAGIGESGGFSTPTSATFSTGQNSPRWGSGVQSPTVDYSPAPRYWQESRTPGRRLSTPSAANPFSSGLHYGAPPPFSANLSYSPSGSMIQSPTTSTAGSGYMRRESMVSNVDMDNRRRTWHPDTASSMFTSRLQNVMTPNHYSVGRPPPPASIVPSQARSTITLPGIESFDPVGRRPVSPTRRAPSPMIIDTPTDYHQMRPAVNRGERPVSSHLDPGFQRQFNHLEIQGPPQPDAASWASNTTRSIQATAEQTQTNQPRVMFEPSTFAPRSGPSSSYHQHTASAPVNMPRGNRRDAWYHGPITTQVHDNRIQGTSPEGSSSSEGAAPVTPLSATMTEPNPAILHANGQFEERPQPPPPQTYYAQQNGTEPAYTYGPVPQPQIMFQQRQQVPKSSNGDYNGLDALAAVATREKNATTASY